MMQNIIEVPFVLVEDAKINIEVYDNTIYYSLKDIGEYLGIGNPNEAKRYLDEKEIKRGSTKQSRTFISIKNVFRLLFYAKNNKLSQFVSWLINVLLPYAFENGMFVVDKEDDDSQNNEEMIVLTEDEDELDDESYVLLNKELKKQNYIFNKEILKIEQLFMELGDVIERANEVIHAPNEKSGDNK